MSILRVFVGYMVLVVLSCWPASCTKQAPLPPEGPDPLRLQRQLGRALDSLPGDTCTYPVCFPDPRPPPVKDTVITTETMRL